MYCMYMKQRSTHDLYLSERYPVPVLNTSEKTAKTHQTIVLRDHVKPGKYAILKGDMDDCVREGWKPSEVPWVARVSYSYSFIHIYVPYSKVFRYCQLYLGKMTNLHMCICHARTRELVVSRGSM